jgi:hypothetical protein
LPGILQNSRCYLAFIKERKLDHWGDNKTIQKTIKQKEEIPN